MTLFIFIQLGRILMLYLGNLYSLMIGLLQYVPAATDGPGEQTTDGQFQGKFLTFMKEKILESSLAIVMR